MASRLVWEARPREAARSISASRTASSVLSSELGSLVFLEQASVIRFNDISGASSILEVLMLRKIVIAIVAAAVIASVPGVASARGGFGGGGFHGGGFHGGFGGGGWRGGGWGGGGWRGGGWGHPGFGAVGLGVGLGLASAAAWG